MPKRKEIPSATTLTLENALLELCEQRGVSKTC